MIAALLDHLWQSTLFAASIALLMPLFRRQAAALRFRLWFAASMKFLLPFSGLAWIGGHMMAPGMPAPILSAIRPVGSSLLKAAPLMAPAPMTIPVADMFLVVWIAGVAVLALVSLSRWLELCATVSEAVAVSSPLPVPVKSAPSFLEPGLVGIWRPVILLPKGLAQQLARAELDAILTHELCHLKRRDNLMAALHMLVEGLFWFHPLVWWLGARLVEERERACDEAVLGAGASPRDYAEGILKTCRFYLQSPLPCASGVSGALEARLGAIMMPRPAIALSTGKAMLLAGLGGCTLLLPLAAGLMGPRPVAQFAARVQATLALPAPILSVPPALPLPAAPVARRSHLTAAPSSSMVPAPAPYRLSAPALAINLLLDVAMPSLPANEPTRVCRPPQPLPDSRLRGPEVCLTTDEWAQLKARHRDVAPDGQSVIATDYEQQRALTGHNCQASLPANTVSNAGGAGMPNCF